ncbi:response regulator [Anaerobacillus sp. CMMVII]|uniref:response regulator transcription factor n=1 Tax=Anaerobacillus sp. CMMVII TaxID=2755588 RepID=UPI0021B79B78|nr:response regulator [Anaerobacillus sp. CMMVII]MCT8139253.1 response regulator [Anaerobacillus sp. CMMVII]
MRILVVEDEPLIRRGLVRLLSQIEVEGLEKLVITDVESAEEADQHLQEHEYDIIFTDIEMGEINGLSLIEKWQKPKLKTQWVIVSGYDKFEFAQKAITFGVKEYLLKPVTKKKLTDTLLNCLQNVSNSQKDFIGADKIEQVINKFEQAIWEINQGLLKEEFNQWEEMIEDKSISLDYYCELLSHMLEVLFHRLKNRGSQITQAVQWDISKETMALANKQFLEKCHEMIKIIEQNRKGNEVDPIEVAKDYINKHIAQEVSLDEVANRLGLNSSYFSQLFKKETGETFVKYRIRLRMEFAKNLLLKKDIRVIDIPSLIGLNDHPHFTKTFKKYTGITPSEFRAKMGID